ncbi:M14 family metallopeptidase [Variovorax boronicumulans]
MNVLRSGYVRRRTLVASALLVSSIVAVAQAAPSPALAQPRITTFKEAFGHEIGEDYFLANYTQLSSYFKTIAAQSPRAKLVDIGGTSEGRRQLMMIVSAPENIKNLAKYQNIARRLASAHDLTPEQARALAAEGKSVVWIDGGLHADETVPAQALIAAVYRALSDNDAEWQRILKDTIILFAQANPDGQELVADWYMRNANPKERRQSQTPRLWNKYVGHDNNRDFYMSSQLETTNINKVLFREWYPQIVYNPHQDAPAGTVVFLPPFRDPFNYNLKPQLITQLEEVGAAMHSRLISEGKPGSTMRSGSSYSTWFNGALRTTPYFHNAIGLLSEIVGSPTPYPLELVAGTQLPRNDMPDPVKPQMWHLSQSIDYSLSMNRAVLDYASRNRERLLHGIYTMGASEIAKGSRDNWTTTPLRIKALEEAAKGREKASSYGWDQETTVLPPELYDKVLHDPVRKDARGYVIPADQADFPTAIKFINALIKNGVKVSKASAPFTVGAKSYPAGSYVVMTAQAYRPHVLDMFEPQDYPQDFPVPGGPPTPPYDSTGYTLAYQMNVAFDRHTEGFTGPFQVVTEEQAPPAGHIVGSGKAGWLIGHETNNMFILTNRLLKAGVQAAWLTDATDVDGRHFAPGAMWVPADAKAGAIITKGVAELGINAVALADVPKGTKNAVRSARIGLVDVYGGSWDLGSKPSGWLRWLYEQYEFPFKQVFPKELDAGNLTARYDVIVVPGGTPGGPYPAPAEYGGTFSNAQPKPEEIPAEMREWLGRMSDEKTVPQLGAFAKAGGQLVTIGRANKMAEPLGLPVRNALVETGKDGKPVPLPSAKFYIPSSLLSAKVDPTHPIAYGMPTDAMVFFDKAPTYVPNEGAAGVKRIAWYPGPNTLKSGWAWGQEKLDGLPAALDVTHGKGRVIMLMPEVAQRGQSHGTFKLIFNSLYRVGAP